MSIDPQEWSDKRMEAGSDVDATQVHIDLIRAVIADELPNITKAVLNQPLDKLGEPVACDTFAEALAPPPEAAGDVPEWLTDYERTYIDRFDTQSLWDAFKAELSRRVAEATAAKDKRIGELEAIVADRSDMVKCVSDANSGLARHRDSLRQQLAAAQAEVASHKEIADVLTKRIDGLREEVERLSRPVDKDSIHARWADIGKFISTVNEFASAVAPLLKAERNARESAEAERDELREFVKAKYFWQSDDRLTKKVCTDNRHWPVTNEDIDKGLSAYRAEKGKVATDGHAPTNS